MNIDASQTEQGARLHYSGMTHATTDDGTTATAHGCTGDAPTGHESISARALFGNDEDHGGVDLLHRMQPGIAATDGVGASRQKVKDPERRYRFRRDKSASPGGSVDDPEPVDENAWLTE